MRQNYALDRGTAPTKSGRRTVLEEPKRAIVRDTVTQVMGLWVLITHEKVWNRVTWQGLLLMKFYWNVATLVYGCFYSQVFATETTEPTKLKRFTIWPFVEV